MAGEILTFIRRILLSVKGEEVASWSDSSHAVGVMRASTRLNGIIAERNYGNWRANELGTSVNAKERRGVERRRQSLALDVYAVIDFERTRGRQ